MATMFSKDVFFIIEYFLSSLHGDKTLWILRTLEKSKKHLSIACVFYISLMFSLPVVFYQSVIHG